MAIRTLSLRLALYLLLVSSCALGSTSDGVTTREEGVDRRVELRDGDGKGRLEEEVSLGPWKRLQAKTSQVIEDQTLATTTTNPQPQRRAPSHPRITPPPLPRRQSDAQLSQLSAQLISLSSASRTISQSSQQLSQSLQQIQNQLSQTAQSLASARASADAARQSAQSLDQERDRISRDADQASQAFARALSSASSSASGAVEGASRSAASVVAGMSQSAQMVMSSAASLVQAARAEATAERTEAETRILQAQGAAVSATQAALAIVGAIIASSLLTIAGFLFFLRLKRRRRSVAVARDRSEPYPVDTIKPPPLAAFPSSKRKSFHLRTPPRGRTKRDEEEIGVGVTSHSPTSDYGLENGEMRERGSRIGSPPSLEKWMRVGTSVSPFGTLVGKRTESRTGNGGNWPLDRKG